MPSEKIVLTGPQRRALSAAAASLDRAYAAARKMLLDMGIERNEEGGTKCLAPPRGHCPGFKPPRRGINCARPGCGHSFAKHDVF
jgi:hypothetical protein